MEGSIERRAETEKMVRRIRTMVVQKTIWNIALSIGGGGLFGDSWGWDGGGVRMVGGWG